MIKIKDSHLNARVAFGASAQPLGERSESEVLDLAIMAQRSGDSSLLKLFDEPLPSLDELLATLALKSLPVVDPSPADNASEKGGSKKTTARN